MMGPDFEESGARRKEPRPGETDVNPSISTFEPKPTGQETKPIHVPSYTMPDYMNEVEWGAGGTPITYGSEAGRGGIPPDEHENESSGPTIQFELEPTDTEEPRYGEDFNFMGGGGYYSPPSSPTEKPSSGGGDFLASRQGGNPPLPEDLVDLPPSGMEAQTPPTEASDVWAPFLEGLGTSTVIQGGAAATAVYDQVVPEGAALGGGPVNLAWNYVYNTIDNSVQQSSTTYEGDTHNVENNTSNNYYQTNNYYEAVGEGAGQVIDTTGILVAIGAAGALVAGALGTLGSTIAGAIAGGFAKGVTSPTPNYSAPPAAVAADEGSERYIGFGGGNSPGKNCEQLLQEIISLGGSSDDLPESCKVPT